MSSTHEQGAAGRDLLGGVAFALAATASIEILLYRVLRPLVLMETQTFPPWLRQGVYGLSTFALNLLWVLSILVCALGLIERARPLPTPAAPVVPDAQAAPPAARRAPPQVVPDLPGRMTLALIGGFFLCQTLLFGAVPSWGAALGISAGRGALLLHGTFVCLLVLLLVSTLPQRSGGRAKLGLLLLTLAPGVQFYGYWSAARGRIMEDLFLELVTYGQFALLFAFLLSPFTFLTWIDRGRAYVAAAVAGLVVMGLGALSWLDWQTAAQLIQHITGMRLPLSRLGQAFFLCSIFGLVFAQVVLLLQGGRLRLRGVGLLLIGLCGYDLHESPRMVLYLAGMILIARSAAALGRRGRPARGA